MEYILIAYGNHIGLDEFPATFTHVVHGSDHAVELDVLPILIKERVGFGSRLKLSQID